MKVYSIIVLCLALPTAVLGLQQLQQPLDPVGPRRKVLQTLGGGLTSAWIAAAGTSKPAMADDTIGGAAVAETSSMAAYQIIPDTGPKLNPSLQAMNPDLLLKQLSGKGGAIWLGEHHNSKKDHVMQEQILSALYQARRLQQNGASAPVAVGLEQVEVQFQPVLDDFSTGKLSMAELRKGVEWDTRWTWPFEQYEPVFAKARELGMPLIALNVNTEDLTFVEQQGLPGLPKDRMKTYIADTTGFAQFASTPEFSTYVDYVIRPSYDMHQALGLLNFSRNGQRLEQEMTFRNFFSGRILWDEAMASRAAAWTLEHPGGLMVGLVGADHVKFAKGIPGRFARIVAEQQPQVSCTSILLNPTLIDTRPSGTVTMEEGASSARPDIITLQVRYLKDGIDRNSPDRTLASSTGGVMPLADYVLIG
eukprot:scaffold2536_cov169-Amphora_coffeaeformis.AAC.17